MSADWITPLECFLGWVGGGVEWAWWELLLVPLRQIQGATSTSWTESLPLSFAPTDPAEKVWVEVEPVGLLKEGDYVKIRCLTDGNPQPDFTINKKVQSAPCWVHGGGIWVQAKRRASAHPHSSVFPQNPNTGEMDEERTDENGLLSLEPAQKHHSGLYQCQSLDLETMITLSSDPLELLVNCEALRWRLGLGKGGTGSSCPG